MMLAEALLDQGKLAGDEGALAWIQRLRTLRLSDGYVQYLEGRAATVEGRWEIAASRLQAARTLLAGQHAMQQRLDSLLAQCYDRLGEVENRVLAVRRAVSAGEEASPAMRLLHALDLEREGRIDSAVSVHLALAAARPESRLDAVRLLIRKNDQLPKDRRNWHEVEECYEGAARALPQRAEELTILRAEIARGKGRIDEARGCLERAMRDNRTALSYRTALARTLGAMGDPAGARRVLDQAEKDLGVSPSLVRTRIADWAAHGQDEDRAALRRLVDAVPRFPAADRIGVLNELATALVSLGEVDAARQALRQLLELQPESLQTLSRLASLALRMGDPSGARAEVGPIVDRMKQLEGPNGTCWRCVECEALIAQAGTVTDATGRDSLLLQATRQNETILAARPEWWVGPMLRGQISELRGRPAEAARDYLAAIDMGASEEGLVHRTFVLLFELQHFDDIDRLAGMLTERTAPPRMKSGWRRRSTR